MAREEEPAKERSPIHERIRELEEEVSKTKYNKRTQHHIGLVKAKIALLKDKQERRVAGKGKTSGYTVRKTGDGTVILVGFPSVGKSTLLNALTDAESRVAAYAFTTLTCIPGLMEYKSAKIQILDVPGIVAGAASGRGRGKEVLSCAMSADLVLFMVDVFHPEHLPIIQQEVRDSHLRVNESKPDVKIDRKERGGVRIGTTIKLTKIDFETIESILKEFRITNADVVVREDITPDQLIDVIEDNKKYVAGVTVLNKIDLAEEAEVEKARKITRPDLCISAEKRTGTEEVKEIIFRRLGFMRVFCKEVGKKADMDVPLIIRKGSTIEDFCRKLHKDFVDKFNFARIWGKSTRFPGQQIRRLNHEIVDKDVIELHLK